MNIGVMNFLIDGGDCFERIRAYGLDVCQLISWDHTLASPETAATVVASSRKANVRISAVWAGLPPPQIWNFKEGPLTLGIVPEATRSERMQVLKKWADFAERIGAPAIVTHCGFIPENMTDPAYPEVVEAIGDIASYCQGLGIGFWLETGQETPVVLLRTIERIGLANVGINLDPANLIMYGKANPVDALDVIGRYVRNVHVKDGLYPTNGEELGKEVPVGEGKVDFPRLLARLREIGYEGELIIEREIEGEQQRKDTIAAIQLLRSWL